MELNEGLFTILINLGTIVLVFGISWGVYKTKLSSIADEINKYGTFKSWVYSEFNSTESDATGLEKELTKKIESSVKEIMLCIKDLEKSIWSIENRCASREGYIKSVPQLTDDLNKLRIEVSSLPSKLSSEIAKSFSDEYQKIISVIVNKSTHKID